MTLDTETRDVVEELLSDRYCLGCNSTIGTGHDMVGSGLDKNFCSICWKPRKPLPLRIRKVLTTLMEERT